MYTGESLAGDQDARVAQRGIAGAEDRQLRVLMLAVLASLVLHGLLLYARPILKEVGRVSAPALTARLGKPSPSEPPKVDPLPAPRPAPVANAAAASAASAPRRPAPAAVPVAPRLSVEPAQQPAEPAPRAPAAIAPGPLAVARSDLPPAPASAPASSGPDPGSVERFRLELMEIARRYKRYPRIAQDNNWQGRVELRIAFAENGAISSLTVKKGAGRAVLDEEAQAMIRSAQPQATIPPALRGKTFVLDIPVDFFLRDEGR